MMLFGFAERDEKGGKRGVREAAGKRRREEEDRDD